MGREALLGLEAADEETSVDPLADLLFTLIAAVLPAILLLAPTLQRTRPLPPPPIETSADKAQAVAVKRRVAVIIAGADGLHLPGQPDRNVGLDHIGEDAGLLDLLDRARMASTPLRLLVEPDGLESAFLFEPVAAAHGPAKLELVRADETCARTHSQFLAAACRGEASASVGP